ncbi:MAG TPA: hypothetical protein VI039_13130 [Solirubrobacterales bacterium]
MEAEPGLITREHALAAAQNVGRKAGYAVACHGSRVRDLDLVAIPWVEDTAYTPLMIAEEIARAIPGTISGKAEKKPHGRLGFVIQPKVHWGFDRWYIDLSVMPRRRRRNQRRQLKEARDLETLREEPARKDQSAYLTGRADQCRIVASMLGGEKDHSEDG